MQKIVCFHLLNDYSGSPIVLKTVLKGLLQRGYHIDLVSSRGGVLDELDADAHLRRRSYDYRFSPHAALTMLRYAWVQVYTFVVALTYLWERGAVFYINTLLPVGPALAGRLTGHRVVYHYHENADVKGLFYRMLARAMQWLAHDIVCVSAYQASMLRRHDKVTVVPNALPETFADSVRPDIDRAFASRTVLMLSSLKRYKGTEEFVALAARLPQVHFILVVNATANEIADYFRTADIQPTANLDVYPRQKDVAPFYEKASLLVSLTLKHQFIETFGLTALEAMTAGLPVIVPTVGGIAEMVDEGVDGYHIDAEHIDEVARHIGQLLDDKTLYARMAQNALAASRRYGADQMVEKIAQELSPNTDA